MLAMPFASVSAVPLAGKNVPNVVVELANVTTTPARGVPAALFSVALRTAGLVADTALVEPVNSRVGVSTTGVGVAPPVLVELLPPPPPPHALNKNSNAIARKDENARDEMFFNLCSASRECVEY